ncbi:GapA-binding peptide SR1P [Pseudogracilibacillus sp. ICA-222130]
MTLVGIIICQECQEVIHYYEEEKVTKLYSTCSTCNNNK